MGDESGVEGKAILILSLACTCAGVGSGKRGCGGVSGTGDGERDASMSSRMSRGESSSRESEEAGMGGELKAGDGSGVGEKLSAWMVGLGSESDMDAKSVRGSDGRG